MYRIKISLSRVHSTVSTSHYLIRRCLSRATNPSSYSNECAACGNNFHLFRKTRGLPFTMPRTTLRLWKNLDVGRADQAPECHDQFMTHLRRNIQTPGPPHFHPNILRTSNLQQNHVDTASTAISYTLLFRNPIQQPPDEECEMSLKQFGSITDLLTKLRADLRASFPR